MTSPLNEQPSPTPLRDGLLFELSITGEAEVIPGPETQE